MLPSNFSGASHQMFPISVLGFSLGTGVAPAILNRVAADRLVLCAGFSSFRSAARAAWIPGFLSPLWCRPSGQQQTLCAIASLPILIVHGDKDRLFPMQMAHELLSCCGSRAELLVLPARSHNEPFYKPQMNTGAPSSPGCSAKMRLSR